MSYTKCVTLALIAVLAAACSNSVAVPSTHAGVSYGASHAAADSAVPPADHTSILKKLTKDVVIGSTVDPNNGDTGPHAISIVETNYGLKKGQLIVCNFANSSGSAGKGTTVEVLNAKPGSKPTTFVQDDRLAGCDGAATTLGDEVCAGGLKGAGELICFDHSGGVVQTYGAPIKAPFSVADVHCNVRTASFCGYSAEYIFVGDAKTGGIVNFSVNQYGNPNEIQVASGFAVNKGSGWSALGPSGLSYNPKRDELYITDGVNDTVVGFTNAGELFVKNEIIVLKGGKTFKCKYDSGRAPCGTLIFAGSPLNAPVAMAMLPNGNLIVANGKGGNTLVEIDVSTGKVLSTKVIDKNKKQAIFALKAIGTKDSNTALYYTDRNDNSLHELEQ